MNSFKILIVSFLIFLSSCKKESSKEESENTSPNGISFIGDFSVVEESSYTVREYQSGSFDTIQNTINYNVGDNVFQIRKTNTGDSLVISHNGSVFSKPELSFKAYESFGDYILVPSTDNNNITVRGLVEIDGSNLKIQINSFRPRTFGGQLYYSSTQDYISVVN